LQKHGIDYEETYSLVIDTITFRFFISLKVTKILDMRVMNVVITYLYKLIDDHIYMKITEEYKMPKEYNSKFEVFIISRYKDFYTG
jgi:hypothetical protein